MSGDEADLKFKSSLARIHKFFTKNVTLHSFLCLQLKLWTVFTTSTYLASLSKVKEDDWVCWGWLITYVYRLHIVSKVHGSHKCKRCKNVRFVAQCKYRGWKHLIWTAGKLTLKFYPAFMNLLSLFNVFPRLLANCPQSPFPRNHHFSHILNTDLAPLVFKYFPNPIRVSTKAFVLVVQMQRNPWD